MNATAIGAGETAAPAAPSTAARGIARFLVPAAVSEGRPSKRLREADCPAVAPVSDSQAHGPAATLTAAGHLLRSAAVCASATVCDARLRPGLDPCTLAQHGGAAVSFVSTTDPASAANATPGVPNKSDPAPQAQVPPRNTAACNATANVPHGDELAAQQHVLLLPTPRHRPRGSSYCDRPLPAQHAPAPASDPAHTARGSLASLPALAVCLCTAADGGLGHMVLGCCSAAPRAYDASEDALQTAQPSSGRAQTSLEATAAQCAEPLLYGLPGSTAQAANAQPGDDCAGVHVWFVRAGVHRSCSTGEAALDLGTAGGLSDAACALPTLDSVHVQDLPPGCQVACARIMPAGLGAVLLCWLMRSFASINALCLVTWELVALCACGCALGVRHSCVRTNCEVHCMYGIHLA